MKIPGIARSTAQRDGGHDLCAVGESPERARGHDDASFTRWLDRDVVYEELPSEAARRSIVTNSFPESSCGLTIPQTLRADEVIQ